MSANAFAFAQSLAQSCAKQLKLPGEPRRNQIKGFVPSLTGKDVFICMPTGGGKSFCFQALPLAFDQINKPGAVILVISPLVALMDSQVKGLNEIIPGYAIRLEKADDVITSETKKIRILYCTPEFLVESQKTQELLRSGYFSTNLRVLVFDEAHCVSLWASFRPAYMEILHFLSLIPHRSIMALTATATPALMIEVTTLLKFRAGYHQVQEGAVNPKLHLSVRDRKDFPYVMNELLGEFRQAAHPKEVARTIIFFTSLEVLADSFLIFSRHLGESKELALRRVSMFHPHIEPEIKQFVLQQLTAVPDGNLRVVFASSAFGLGIDARGIKRVFHHSSPRDVDDYVQESGRGGRGGEASAVLFNKGRNLSSSMKDYLALTTCRREFLSRLMNFSYQPGLQRCCDICDLKREEPE